MEDRKTTVENLGKYRKEKNQEFIQPFFFIRMTSLGNQIVDEGRYFLMKRVGKKTCSFHSVWSLEIISPILTPRKKFEQYKVNNS